MSAKVMGAVMQCGPRKVRLRLALAGIADNADDFGFASVSIETIASKAVCDVRTAMRVVQELEQTGWMKVHRRVVGGKGSVYFVDVEKLGVVVDNRSRKSEWHVEFERARKAAEAREIAQKSGDKTSPVRASAVAAASKVHEVKGLREGVESGSGSGDKMSRESGAVSVDSPFLSPESGDNSQGVQVTFPGGSGDKTLVAILKNRFNHLNQSTTPQPPDGGIARTAVRMMPQCDGREASCDASADAAVAKVLRERGICDLGRKGGIAAVIRAALVSENARCDGPADWNATAERMIVAGEKLAQAGREDLLFRVPNPREFYGSGMWRDCGLWPYDQRAVREMQQRQAACVGMR